MDTYNDTKFKEDSPEKFHSVGTYNDTKSMGTYNDTKFKKDSPEKFRNSKRIPPRSFKRIPPRSFKDAPEKLPSPPHSSSDIAPSPWTAPVLPPLVASLQATRGSLTAKRSALPQPTPWQRKTTASSRSPSQ
jgi:hypothetical protein